MYSDNISGIYKSLLRLSKASEIKLSPVVLLKDTVTVPYSIEESEGKIIFCVDINYDRLVDSMSTEKLRYFLQGLPEETKIYLRYCSPTGESLLMPVRAGIIKGAIVLLKEGSKHLPKRRIKRSEVNDGATDQ